MQIRPLIAAACLLGCSAASAAGAPPPARHELPVSDCLRTDRISNWAVVDQRTAIVSNGPNRYRVQTTADCPRMGLGGGIHFRASESDKAAAPMRLCGGINEQIVRRDDPPCQILSIEKIDKQTYDTLEKRAQERHSGAEPNGAVR
jgi:hypothetical protein